MIKWVAEHILIEVFRRYFNKWQRCEVKNVSLDAANKDETNFLAS